MVSSREERELLLHRAGRFLLDDPAGQELYAAVERLATRPARDPYEANERSGMLRVLEFLRSVREASRHPPRGGSSGEVMTA